MTLFFAIGITTPLVAQGRKREHRNQHRGTGSRKSNSFAYGGHRNGFFSRVFSGRKVTAGGWVYKPTRPGKKQNMEQRHLFTRYRTKSKRSKDGIQARLNRERSKKRIHGNASFSKRKY
ncbi:MAG: hypothetical protein ACXVPQ_02175 [Bacteroidia bacterium]